MQAVILAGGLGTRLRPLTDSVPKAMVPVNGRPFLEYEIDLLKSHGITDYVLCVGFMGEKIEDHFGDGKGRGVNIRYSHDGPKGLLGPAGALKKADPLLNDTFFVTYGDAYLRLDYRRVMKELLASGRLGLMAVYKNENKYGRSDLVVKGSLVAKYDKKNQSEDMLWINFGVSALQKEALKFIPEGRNFGEEEFYNELIKRKELVAFPTNERFYEIGNLNSLEEFERFAANILAADKKKGTCWKAEEPFY